jgi:hypothetical protein
MSKTTQDANQLLKNAQQEGDLSQKSMQALTNIDIGAQIQAGLGVAADDVQASDVFLISMLVDDSGSIEMAGNTQLVKDGHNLHLASFADSKQKESFLVHCRYLNGKILYPFKKLQDADKMDGHNYRPGGGTPLYDQTLVTLATVVAKTKEFEDSGVPVRTITSIITDGADTSSHATASQVKSIIEDMLKKEKHIVAFMGIDDNSTDFKAVAKSMGIRPEWILTPKNDPKEIRKAFNVLSQSAVRASQNAASFSKTALGGFGAP